MKFLIVDDSRAMHALVQRSLVKAGYDELEVKTACNGHEALDIIHTWHPTVVLTDWHMPDMDGIQLLEAIQEQGLDLKIGLITTERSPQRKEMAISKGAGFVLSKPFSVEELQEALNELLK